MSTKPAVVAVSGFVGSVLVILVLYLLGIFDVSSTRALVLVCLVIGALVGMYGLLISMRANKENTPAQN